MKVAIFFSLLLAATLPSARADWVPDNLGSCYAEIGCGGGFLGFKTRGQCASVYGRSWQDQDNVCYTLGTGPQLHARGRRAALPARGP